jgi:EF-hand domain pair
LYAHHKELFAVFSFFDKDGDGRISRDEFAAGCEALSKLDGGATSAGAVFKDSASLLEIMDLHGRGVVDINEFYEMFRVSETLASKSNQQLQQQLQQQQQAQAPVLQRRRASFQLPKRSDSVQDGVTSVSIEGVARSITSDPELLKLSTSPTSPTSPYSPVGGGGIAAAVAAAVAAAEASSPVPVDI